MRVSWYAPAGPTIITRVSGNGMQRYGLDEGRAQSIIVKAPQDAGVNGPCAIHRGPCQLGLTVRRFNEQERRPGGVAE